jgi:hypothetical protein
MGDPLRCYIGGLSSEAEMGTLKKVKLILKLGFLSVFGTSKGLANVEEELAILSGEKKVESKEKEKAKPTV